MEHDEIVQQFSETQTSPELAKKIIDALDERGLDVEMFAAVIWKIEQAIKEEAVAAKMQSVDEEEISTAINEVIEECIADCCPYSEVLSEIVLSE